MMWDRTAVEAVNYKPVAPTLPINRLMGDLRSYETTIRLAVEMLAEGSLNEAQAERHLGRLHAAIAQSNEILAEIKAVYGHPFAA
ncbi:MAG: hypothetical protein HC918_01050 [Oscillatoriales cyanobacterium SM2_1_8]|nr:hypothetical protein [Oscillatoriales cyanobacterium SM2_1_8]